MRPSSIVLPPGPLGTEVPVHHCKCVRLDETSAKQFVLTNVLTHQRSHLRGPNDHELIFDDFSGEGLVVTMDEHGEDKMMEINSLLTDVVFKGPSR